MRKMRSIIDIKQKPGEEELTDTKTILVFTETELFFVLLPLITKNNCSK